MSSNARAVSDAALLAIAAELLGIIALLWGSASFGDEPLPGSYFFYSLSYIFFSPALGVMAFLRGSGQENSPVAIVGGLGVQFALITCFAFSILTRRSRPRARSVSLIVLTSALIISSGLYAMGIMFESEAKHAHEVALDFLGSLRPELEDVKRLVGGYLADSIPGRYQPGFDLVRGFSQEFSDKADSAELYFGHKYR